MTAAHYVPVQSFIPANTKHRLDIACNQMRVLRGDDYAKTFAAILELGISALAREQQIHDYNPIEFEAQNRG
jgi:hypothetical protein